MLKVKQGKQMLFNMFVLFICAFAAIMIVPYYNTYTFCRVMCIAIMLFVACIGICQIILAIWLYKYAKYNMNVTSKVKIIETYKTKEEENDDTK